MQMTQDRPVAVLGLGTMGHGIAQTFAVAGYTVRGFDDQPEARASLKARVRGNLARFVEAGLIAAEAVEPALGRIHACDSLSEAVAGAAFVTEAVKEALEIKQALFAEIEPLVPPDCILASNSSTFPISQSGSELRLPGRGIVTHWFNPPHLVPLVEVVPGPATEPAVTEATVDLMRGIGKRPIRLRRELPGFLVNRIQVALMREIWDLLEKDVASAEEIDEAVSASIGFRLAAIGPLEVHDFGGLDIQSTVFRNLAPEIRDGSELPEVVRQLVEQGRLGAKAGAGFMEYPPDRLRERRERRDDLFLQLAALLYAPDENRR